MIMRKIIKEYKVVVILAVVLMVGILFLGYELYQCHQWWKTLSPEEQQQITLTGERNYSYDYLDGVITDIDDIYYWAGSSRHKTVAEIYCAEMNETFTYEDNDGKLWMHKNSEHVKCERVIVTNGYGEVVEQFLNKKVKLYD